MGKKELLEEIDEITKDNIARAWWMEDFKAENIPEEVLEHIINYKNSSKAFGERMHSRLQDLIDNPDSYTPSYKKRYQNLIKHCSSLTALQAYALNHLLGMDSSRKYQNVPEEANLQFPQDFTPQLGYQVGWHFFVGNCTSDEGKDYGILVSFYRYSLLPPPIARNFGLTDMENQICELQLAVAEAGGEHIQAKPFAVSGTTGVLKTKNQPFEYSIGKNRIKSQNKDELFPLGVQAWGVNQGGEKSVEIEVDLQLSSNKELLLQGNKGCLPCCCSIGTLYYSATNLSLEPGSILKIDGKEIQLCEGKFWHDHQWGNALEPLGNPRCEVMRAANNLTKPSRSRGWDWFMAQFEGDREITMYAPHTDANLKFYHQTGVQPPNTMDVAVAGQFIDKDHTIIDVKGRLMVDEWVKSKKSSDPHQYLITNTWYPNKWEFQFEDMVPEDIRNFVMTPIVEGGQTGYNASGAQYSEGGVYIKNPNGDLIGKGFAESVYYADSLPNMLNLAGISDTPEMRELVEKPLPSAYLKLKSFLYLAWPSNQKKLKKILKKCVEQGLPTVMIG